MPKIKNTIFGKSLKNFDKFPEFRKVYFYCELCNLVAEEDHNIYCDVKCLRNKIGRKNENIKEEKRNIIEIIKESYIKET